MSLKFRTNAIKEQQTNSSSCVHHNKPFKFYCESCQEPICQSCTTLGPHNNNLHRVNQLQDAFKQQVHRIQEEVKTNLLEKRESILAQVHRLEYRMEEVQYVSNLIERDARAELGGVLDRLKHQVGSKLAILQHEIQLIQNDLDEMNDLVIQFHELIKENDMVGFLENSNQMHTKLEYLIAKPYKQGVDISADDLPKELTNLRMELHKAEVKIELKQKLDMCIWQIIQDRKQQQELMKSKLEKDAQEELDEWEKLVDFFTMQVRKQQLVCHFCNGLMNAQIINKKCKENHKELADNFVGYTKGQPPDEFKGTQRHYWSEPLEQQKIQDLIKTNNKKPPNSVLIEQIMSKIKKRIQEHGIELEKIFEEHDKQNKGKINEIQFQFILLDKVQLTEEEIENLIRFLDDEQKNILDYRLMFLMMKNNNLIKEKGEELQRKYYPKKQKSVPMKFTGQNTIKRK